MIPVCHNLRRYANKVFKGIATDGKGTMGWCHGFKLHLACNDRGEIIDSYLLAQMSAIRIRKYSKSLLNVCMASCLQTKDISRRSCLTFF